MWHKTMEPVVCQRSCQWSPNHSTRQSRLSDNSHGQLDAASYHCHLIKARQALPQSFQNYIEPWKSRLEKQTWLSILFCCGIQIVHECNYIVSQYIDIKTQVLISMVNKRDSNFPILPRIHAWSILPGPVTFTRKTLYSYCKTHLKMSS